ncbi:hypothetical protein B7486_30620 [cyanobacterium TDX16]|nr:hypothetical protein B7486_30620 [cyanobacterium TDX16]
MSKIAGWNDFNVIERIRQLSLTQLENLAEALLEFYSSEDLVNWLNNSAN